MRLISVIGVCKTKLWWFDCCYSLCVCWCDSSCYTVIIFLLFVITWVML